MTDDPVEVALAAFIDQLDGRGPGPTLDDLSPDDRAEAQRLFNLLRAGRGIDASLSRPSLAALLAGTEFEDWATSGVAAEQSAGADRLTVEAIRDDVLSALGPGTAPVSDVASLAEGISSQAVLVVRGQRLRLQFHGDLAGPNELAALDPAVVAGPIFGRFPETAGVIAVYNDDEHSSVAIGPYDIDAYLGTPDGELHQPHIVRPVLPLGDALRLYLSEIAPDLSLDTDDDAPVHIVDIAEIARRAAAAACGTVADEGKRAHTSGKKEVWSPFGGAEAALINDIAYDVANGNLSAHDLEERLDKAAEAA